MRSYNRSGNSAKACVHFKDSILKYGGIWGWFKDDEVAKGFLSFASTILYPCCFKDKASMTSLLSQIAQINVLQRRKFGDTGPKSHFQHSQLVQSLKRLRDNVKRYLPSNIDERSEWLLFQNERKDTTLDHCQSFAPAVDPNPLLKELEDGNANFGNDDMYHKGTIEAGLKAKAEISDALSTRLDEHSKLRRVENAAGPDRDGQEDAVLQFPLAAYKMALKAPAMDTVCGSSPGRFWRDAFKCMDPVDVCATRV